MTHLETTKSIVCALLAANGCGVILNSLQAVKDLACDGFAFRPGICADARQILRD
jgi:hypothetical protein